MIRIIFIAAGGATGALLRYWLSNGVHVFLDVIFLDKYIAECPALHYRMLAGHSLRKTDMNETEVIVVRIYLHEAKAHMAELLKYLHDESKVRGVTVFRGITGFGSSGQYHSSTLMDMSLDLSVVIEFYDEPENVKKSLNSCAQKLSPGILSTGPQK